MTDMEPLAKIDLFGTQLTLCDSRQLLTAVAAMIESGRRGLVLSGNVYSFNLACQHQWLQDFFNQADVVRLDGAGVRLGAKILGYDTPPRMTWADFAWQLAEFAQMHDYTLFFLGARPGIAEQAAERLKQRFAALRVVGTHHGYFDKTPSSAENQAVIQQINVCEPHILIIGFGMPLQERWLLTNRGQIKANVIFTGGAVFDYISGQLRRPPRWMTDNGLEWLGRLWVEPRRLWQRYLVGNPLFLWRILRLKL